MSDRFVLDSSKGEVEQLFGVSSEREDYFEPNFNITPGSLIPAVYADAGKRKITQFVWGLIPEDAEEETDGRENYEVAVESLEADEWLSSCLAKRRCLIPASGFYKWKFSEKKSTPFFIRLLANKLTAIAGIYSVWESSSGRDVYSCAMLTTKANALVQPVDDRMPVLLSPKDQQRWLENDEMQAEDVDQFLDSYAVTDLAVNRVSEDVNNIENNSAKLIQPIPK